jgi:14-3-3 protein epsilon
MSTEESIFMGRVAEQAERYEDMVDFLNPVVKEKGSNLSVEERNLLSVAFKNLVGSRRTAWRTISAIEQNPKYSHFAEAIGGYKSKVEAELYKNCEDIISSIEGDILPGATDNEAKAFFQKMIGDYYRYIAEAASGDKLKNVTERALTAYDHATETANLLGACSPIKLGLALNFSVFHYEVMNDSKKACSLAETALKEAQAKASEVDEDTFRDARSILELL